MDVQHNAKEHAVDTKKDKKLISEYVSRTNYKYNFYGIAFLYVVFNIVLYFKDYSEDSSVKIIQYYNKQHEEEAMYGFNPYLP